MKLLLVLLVVAVGLMLLLGRSRRRDSEDAAPPERRAAPRAPSAMIACAHCGVHLPGDDAVRDDAGRSYCGDEHRRAGPR